MKKILFLALLASSVSVSSYAQTDRKLIADETYISRTDDKLKVFSGNDSITNVLIVRFNDSIRVVTLGKRSEIKGVLKENRITMPATLMDEVVLTLQSTNNKSKLPYRRRR